MAKKLTLNIRSFSYKQGYPEDESIHGGGYVFDCRGLPNPGREEKYKNLTGLDAEVVQYLNSLPEVETFLSQVTALVEQHLKVFIDRDFDYLAVSFGCTGGQHRSVFCVETLKNRLQSKYSIDVVVEHINLKKLGYL